MSSGKVWLRPFSRTLTSWMTPLTPETAMSDGYGVAGPSSGIEIGVGFENC